MAREQGIDKSTRNRIESVSAKDWMKAVTGIVKSTTNPLSFELFKFPCCFVALEVEMVKKEDISILVSIPNGTSIDKPVVC